MTHVQPSQVAGMGYHYIYYPLDYLFDTQAAAGYTTIELVAQAPHYFVGEKGYQDPAQVRGKAEAHGLTIGALVPEDTNYPFRINLADDTDRQRSLEYYKQVFEAAEGFGTHVVPVCPWGATKDEDPQAAFERLCATVAALAPCAQDHGVVMAVTNLSPSQGTVCTTLDEMDRLLAAVDHPAAAANLDLGAMGIAGETPEQWFDLLGKKIVHMYFADGRPCGHMVWGEGLFPLERYLEVANRYGYEGLLGQKITDGAYFDDPAAADKRNLSAFEPYFAKEA